MRRTLDDFVKYYHLNAYQNTAMLDWIKNVYQPVLPVTITDGDLPQFLSVIYSCVRYYKPEVVVQTGTFIGTSSLAIAKSCKDNKKGVLFTIDPEPPAYFGVDEPVQIARRAVSHAQLQDSVHFLKGYSTVPNDRERMFLVPGEEWLLKEIAEKCSYDILVVDGDHTFEGCFNDLYYGAAGLSSKGPRLIIVHDYLGIPSVKQAVRHCRQYFKSFDMKVVPSPCGIALIQLN